MVKTKNMNIRIAEEEYDAIKSFADFQGYTVSEIVLNAIREQMELWEDIRDIESRKGEPASSLADVKKRLGMT